MSRRCSVALVFLIALASAGCRSPYYADRGALAGGLGGAGLGALIGSVGGHAGAGAAIGAAAGALTGGAVGGALDDIDARNRAQIAAQMGRPLAAGATSIQDVVAMSQAGVDQALIINHINTNGMQRPLQPNDIIYLQQSGVGAPVVAAMQQPRVMAAPPGMMVAGPPPPGMMVAGPPPVFVQQRYYGPPPYWRPNVGVGVSVVGH